MALRQVWLILAQWFWRKRRKCEKFTVKQTDRQTNDRRHAIKKAHLSSHLSEWMALFYMRIAFAFFTKLHFSL